MRPEQKPIEYPQFIPSPTAIHAGDAFANRFAEGGHYHWREPHPPRQSEISALRTASFFHACGYCGSMHPTELAFAIENGARLECADRKYGWPHKFYVHNAPARFVGMMEVRMSHSYYDKEKKERIEESGPEEPIKERTDHGKFYSLHLQDANAGERVTIERAMGINFSFTSDGMVSWQPFQEPSGEGRTG